MLLLLCFCVLLLLSKERKGKESLMRITPYKMKMLSKVVVSGFAVHIISH